MDTRKRMFACREKGLYYRQMTFRNLLVLRQYAEAEK